MILLGAPTKRLTGQSPLATPPPNSSRRALFLDRDGVLNHDLGYVVEKKDFRWIDGSPELVAWAARHGFLVILITNQSGIGRGYFTVAQFEQLMSWVGSHLDMVGGRIAACYFSSLSPDIPISEQPISFQRKPSAEMVIAALDDFRLERECCILVGDKESDAVAGLRGGLGQVFLVGDKVTSEISDDGFWQYVVRSTHSELMGKIASSHVCDRFCASSS